jgi:toxin HigB-1
MIDRDLIDRTRLEDRDRLGGRRGPDPVLQLGGTLRAIRKHSLTDSNVSRYYLGVIKGFRDRDAERLFDRRPTKRFGPDVQRVALRKLRMLDAATTLEDLRVPPGNRLERLRGDRVGQHSIRINGQWRVCFRWRDGAAHDVEIVDYH